jgi:hypothetical protein
MTQNPAYTPPTAPAMYKRPVELSTNAEDTLASRLVAVVLDTRVNAGITKGFVRLS